MTSIIQRLRQDEAERTAAAITSLNHRMVEAHIGCADNHHTFAWASRQAITDAPGAKIVLSLCADLPALHQSAIEIADEVLVLNLAGYIDPRTLHELCAAYNQRKPIAWLEPWTMYCPVCGVTGLEAEHFFHNTLSLRGLNDLFESLSQEQLTYLDGQLADWYGQLVPVVLMPDGYPALQVDLSCTHCNHFARTAYAVAGEHGAWTTLLDADGTFLVDLCDADRRVQVLSCPDVVLQTIEQQVPAYRHLTAEDILERSAFQSAIKVAGTRIRPFTEEDVLNKSGEFLVDAAGTFFLDLEMRRHTVQVGRYLCVGSQGERWTSSAKSMQDRVAVSMPDADGFRQYRQRAPHPVQAVILTEPFALEVHGDLWQSQKDGGVITWNGKTGNELQMRVITRSAFSATYQMVDAEVCDGE